MASDGTRFEIRLMKEKDREEVAKLVSKVFTEREPVNLHMKHDERFFYEEFGKLWSEECLKDNLSFVCLDTTLDKGCQIVGFRFCRSLQLEILLKNKSKSLETQASDFNDRDALTAVVTEFKIEWFKQHSESSSSTSNPLKCLYFLALGVKSGYENHGIATKLIECSMNNGKLLGYDYVFVLATSLASQHLFANKYKFTEVVSKNYEDIEFNGNYFLKDLTNPKQLISYEYNLQNWRITRNETSCFF